MRTFGSSIVLAAAVIAASATLTAQEPNFGRAVQMTDTELFVGQPVNWYGPGVVYGYRLTDSGMWREQGRLTAPDSARMDDFGRAIAADGNHLVVGAPRKRDGTGVAYAFTREGASGPWGEVQTIEAPNPSQFGSAIALSGNDLFIGSPDADSTGAVYHYTRSSAGWQLQSAITPGDAPGKAGFGTSLSIEGDWLLVGAPAAKSRAGRVYTIGRSADGEWGAPTPLNISATLTGARAGVGASVLLDGDRAFLGAPNTAVVVVLALGDNGSWRPTGTLRPFDVSRGSGFGSSITTVSGEVWVSAPRVNGGNGRVYRFLSDGDGGWKSALRFVPDSADGTSWPFSFGHSMASNGDMAVVSMPSRDFGEGRVMATTRDGDGWNEQQMLEGQIYTIGGGAAPATKCEDGQIGAFTCSNMELVSHMPNSALGGERGVWVNDVWGWTDPDTRRDYALIAKRDGASFVDVTDPAGPRLVGTLPRTAGSRPSVWRDIKVLNNHAYIVADGAGNHGVQVFDLTRLRGTTGASVTFAPDTTYHEIASAHNVVADTSSGFLYVVGANSGGETCGGGLHMVDARDPQDLKFSGCYNDRGGSNPRGYSHDAQCLNYNGPDVRYRGREICIGSNEKEINIADVTDKSNPMVIGRNSYPDVVYAHQGWFDEEQRYFYMNDENDEAAGVVEGTRTIVWDLSKLDDPIVANMYIGPVNSSDHNLFVKGDRIFEANYGSGLRVLDISDRANPREVGFFDSAPMNNDGPGHSSTQSGAWSNYPFFESGVIIFTSVREGLFIVRVMETPIT